METCFEKSKCKGEEMKKQKNEKNKKRKIRKEK